MQVDFACELNCGLGMSTKVWGRAGNNGSVGEYPRGQHARRLHVHVVYRSLKVADTVVAVCLRPPRDASVSPGVQRSESDP